MARRLPEILLLAGLAFCPGLADAAAPAATGRLIFSDLCRRTDGFSGERLSLARAPGGDSGEYQWGDTPAVTAPLEQLKIGTDGSIAFRYMPDADNPEVYVHVSGKFADTGFSGEADGKPLHLPPSADLAIPPCKD